MVGGFEGCRFMPSGTSASTRRRSSILHSDAVPVNTFVRDSWAKSTEILTGTYRLTIAVTMVETGTVGNDERFANIPHQDRFLSSLY